MIVKLFDIDKKDNKKYAEHKSECYFHVNFMYYKIFNHIKVILTCIISLHR